VNINTFSAKDKTRENLSKLVKKGNYVSGDTFLDQSPMYKML